MPVNDISAILCGAVSIIANVGAILFLFGIYICLYAKEEVLSYNRMRNEIIWKGVAYYDANK